MMNTGVDGREASARRRHFVPETSAEILKSWLDELRGSGPTALIDRATLEDICSGLLEQIAEAVETAPMETLPSGSAPSVPSVMGKLLSSISTNFAERGLTPSQTAGFIFGLKRHLKPLNASTLAIKQRLDELIDAMGLFTMDAFIQRREQILTRQTQELLEISVPVVPLWEGILSLPIIGTLDSGRAQAITEKLLFELARTNSRHAILDISGVPTVDTQTAQYLGKTVAAARLMGAECVITGIRPAIAQVMVALGINLASIETRFSLAEGLRYCFAKQGLLVKRREV